MPSPANFCFVNAEIDYSRDRTQIQEGLLTLPFVTAHLEVQGHGPFTIGLTYAPSPLFDGIALFPAEFSGTSSGNRVQFAEVATLTLRGFPISGPVTAVLADITISGYKGQSRRFQTMNLPAFFLVEALGSPLTSPPSYEPAVSMTLTYEQPAPTHDIAHEHRRHAAAY